MGLVYVVLALVSLSIILPLINIIALSFNDGKDASLGGIAFWPRVFSVANYQEVFANPEVLRGLKITLFRTIVGTVSSIVLTSMAAFALKKSDLPGGRIFSAMLVFTMLFNGGLVPYYMVLKSIHLTNTIWVFVIPMLYSAWNLILVRTFFKSIDVGIEESAYMDGANEFQILFKLIIPLSLPILSVIGLFTAVGHWNDWFGGTFYVSDKGLRPLQTILQQMLNSAEAMRKNMSMNFHPNDPRMSVTGESMKMATVIISVVPIACIYPFIQKYFVQGIMVGSIKG
jgi:putative aldouronate transport system permease protein